MIAALSTYTVAMLVIIAAGFVTVVALGAVVVGLGYLVGGVLEVLDWAKRRRS